MWAIAVRLLFSALVPRQLQGDAVDYEQLAVNLAAGRGFTRCFFEPFNPTAQRPPLYPMVLAIWYMVGWSHAFGAMLLNLILDLVSMKLVTLWSRDLKLTWGKYAPWVIAFCPLLITYGMYPTTENLSITLFLLATLLLFRRKAVLSGLMWGLLALCRSYYLLFPLVLLVGFRKFKIAKDLGWKGFAILAVMSFVGPSIWMVRNYQVIGKVAFTQTSMVGWQAYQGLCVANFDWWRPEHLAHMYSVPVFYKMITGHCTKEEQIASLDQEAKQLVYQCIADRPFDTLRNVLTKGMNLFVNWGLFMPYNRVPFMVQHVVNAFMYVYWFCVFMILWKHRKKIMGQNGGAGEVLRYSLLNIAYIVAVTIPFAVDARYLLGPFLTTMFGVFEYVRTPGNFLRSGLRRD